MDTAVPGNQSGNARKASSNIRMPSISRLFQIACPAWFRRYSLVGFLVISAGPLLAQDQAPAVTGTQTAGRVQHQAADAAGQAEAALVRGDWKTARPLLETWLEKHPEDPVALFEAGYVADAEGNRTDDAIRFYEKAAGLDTQYFEPRISLGLLLARLGRSLEARPYLEAATALDPGPGGPTATAKAWRALARINLHPGNGHPDAQQASIDLLQALKLTPETTADSLLTAQIAEASGDATEAETAYRKVLVADPTSVPASTGLVHLLIQQKKYEEAETRVRDALKIAPEDPALTAQLAAVLVAEDKAEALPVLQDFHKKRPNEPAITKMLAEVEADAGEYSESDALYITLLAAEPTNASLLTGHGQNLIRLRRYPEALKAFEQATQLDETNGEAWNGLAFAAFETHQPTITLHALTVRSKYLPENPTIYFLWATAYDTLHDKKQAVVYYHHFLDSAAGKLPDQEWQARQRLALLEKTP